MPRVLSAAAAKKRAKRAAKKRAAEKRAAEKKRGPPQRDVQGHLAMLDGDLRAKKPPHPDPRTNRRKKTRGPRNWNGGRRGDNKTNAKSVLRDALRDM
jgi:hypothetical protein